MAEQKRIFSAGKMNKDLDDRLVPPGEYRDALNVGIGRSEGSDVGAVENLKGNELIAGQENISGTTIGSLRDPSTNNVYWFTKGDTFDGIYEYASDTGEVNTILRDPVARENVRPTCTPEFATSINTPVSDSNNRPDIDFDNRYSTPVGGCTNPSATNYNATATYDDGSCSFAPPPVPTLLSVAIAGDGTFANTDSPVTLTANASNVLGTLSYLWSTSETSQTLSVSGMDTTITGSVTVTDSGRVSPNNTATDTYSVTFQSTAPTTYTWGFESTYQGVLPAGLSLSGGRTGERTEDGVLFVVPRDLSMIEITQTGMVWDQVPAVRTENLPTGVGITALSPTQAEASAGNIATAANVEVFGSYTPTGNEFGRIIWSGGSIRARSITFGPMNFRALASGPFNLPVFSDTPVTSSNLGDFTVRTFTGDNNISRTGADISSAFAGHVVGGLRSSGNLVGTKYLLGTIGSTNYNVAGTVAADSGGAMSNFNFTVTGVTQIS